MTEHKKQIIRCPLSNERVEIDCQLVQLIKAIWKKGIATLFCCQDSYNDGTHFEVDMNHDNFVMFLSLMRNSKDMLIKDAFSRVLWDKRDHQRSVNAPDKPKRNLVYLHAWVSNTTCDKTSSLKIRLEIPTVLKPLIEFELKLLL